MTKKLELKIGENYSVFAQNGQTSFAIDYADYLGESKGIAYFRYSDDKGKYAIASPADHLTEREDGVIALSRNSSGTFVEMDEVNLLSHHEKNIGSLLSKLEVQNA